MSTSIGYVGAKMLALPAPCKAVVHDWLELNVLRTLENLTDAISDGLPIENVYSTLFKLSEMVNSMVDKFGGSDSNYDFLRTLDDRRNIRTQSQFAGGKRKRNKSRAKRRSSRSRSRSRSRH